MGMLVSILIGALAGFIVGKSKDLSLLRSIIAGTIGGFLGSWLFSIIGLPVSGSFWGQLLTGAIGAFVIVLLFSKILGRKKAKIIRWYIDSNPNGADVAWRVISTTPKVQNTNLNYLGTTPYETTEAFNIKGLSKSNSSKVQIEICCEKDGFISQTKRFNLGQVLEQCEISTKFNLVRE